MEYHHVGILTDKKQENETYIEDCKAYITDFESHPFRVEWVRFEEDSPMPKAIKTTSHIAFKVDDLEEAIKGKNIIVEPFEPMEGIKAAFILTEDGAPVELMQFD